MRDYLTLCSTPVDEDCTQLGTENYGTKAQKECKAFINQLRRQFGPEPDGAKLRTKAFPHDFGSYYEVVVYYDTEIKKTIDYAFNIEANLPENWDNEAISELSNDPACKIY